MKYNLFIGIVLFCLFSTKVTAQTDTKQEDTTAIEHIRAESGLDPIIIHSKIAFTSFINDPKGPSGRIANSVSLSLSVKRWSIGLKGSLVSVMSGNPGEGFHSAAGDFELSLQNKVYAHGKHAIAVTGVLAFPTGKMGYGSQYFSFTPVLTYIYALKPSVIFALQPQYSFHVMKDQLYPGLSLLTVRALAAKFTKTGLVFGMEMKPIINIEANIFYLFTTLFVGKSLGAGFNILFLCDAPANKPAVEKGPTFQFGINRNI
jgi:hypothetical protein